MTQEQGKSNEKWYEVLVSFRVFAMSPDSAENVVERILALTNSRVLNYGIISRSNSTPPRTMTTTTFVCDRCHKQITHTSDVTTGYSVSKKGEKHCFACCALDDIEQMRRDGKTVLYLYNLSHTLTNWPGTLEFHVYRIRKGKHNIARTRYDVWFTFEKQPWYGVQYGEDTQIVHCRRIDTREQRNMKTRIRRALAKSNVVR